MEWRNFAGVMRKYMIKLRILTAMTAAAAALPAAADVFGSLPDSTFHYEVTLNGSLSAGDHTPFWLVNNRQGLASLERNNGYIRGALTGKGNIRGDWGWSFGADMAVAGRYQSVFNIQQLYAGVNWRGLALEIGSKERHATIGDWRLSSGDLLFSENSRPIPQARLEVADYVVVPWTKGWLAAKGYVSLGYFTDSHWAEHHVGKEMPLASNVLFHSKGLFFRVGNPAVHQFTWEGGFEMGAQWGGKIRRYDASTGKFIYSKMGHSLKDLWHILVPSSGGDPSDPMQAGEITNVYGNHTGQWSTALDWHPAYTQWGVKAYYKHFFEDHSMMTFDFPWRDMLIGAEIRFPKNPVAGKFVYEYLNTRFQSGSAYWDQTTDIPYQVSGRDNYYNHGIYNGWQHWGMGIGNPLLLSPVYNADNALVFYHNRVKSHHFALAGSPLPQLDYRLLFTYTRSWGTYNDPTPQVMYNYNLLAELTWRPARLKGYSATIGLGADWGGMAGRNKGIMFTISKSGWL